MYQFTCVSICPLNSYKDNLSCIKCPIMCNTCVSSTNCSTCITGYVLNNNQCIKNCIGNTYLNNG
jgi:hypothetical protein